MVPTNLNMAPEEPDPEFSDDLLGIDIVGSPQAGKFALHGNFFIVTYDKPAIVNGTYNSGKGYTWNLEVMKWITSNKSEWMIQSYKIREQDPSDREPNFTTFLNHYSLVEKRCDGNSHWFGHYWGHEDPNFPASKNLYDAMMKFDDTGRELRSIATETLSYMSLADHAGKV